MAYAVDTPTILNKKLQDDTGLTHWACNVRSDNISGCETIKDAPGTGYSLCLTGIIISSGAALTITIGEGNAGAGVTTAIMGPITFAAGQLMVWKFDYPLALTTNTILSCDASGAGDVNIYVEGFTAKR